MSATHKVTAIGRARCGWYWDGYMLGRPGNTFSVSGCYKDLPSCLTDGDSDCEGAVVIDKRAISELPGFVRLVMREPLLAKHGEQPERFAQVAAKADLMVAGLVSAGGAFGGMLVAEKAGALNLDTATECQLAEYWRPHGARIGVVRAGVIAWEDGGVA